MMYIYILDYTAGTCDIMTFPEDKDVVDWLVEQDYNLDNIEWMTSKEFHLNVVI